MINSNIFNGWHIKILISMRFLVIIKTCLKILIMYAIRAIKTKRFITKSYMHKYLKIWTIMFMNSFTGFQIESLSKDMYNLIQGLDNRFRNSAATWRQLTLSITFRGNKELKAHEVAGIGLFINNTSLLYNKHNF